MSAVPDNRSFDAMGWMEGTVLAAVSQSVARREIAAGNARLEQDGDRQVLVYGDGLRREIV